MINISRLSAALSANVLSEVANKIFPLVVVAYTARVLGVKEFGFAQYAIYIVDIALPFITMGYGNWGIINIAKMSNSTAKISEQVSSIIALKLLGTVILTSIFFPILYFTPNLHKYFHASLALSFVFPALALDASFLFYALKKIPYFTLISFAAKCLGLILTLSLVKDSSDSLTFAIIYMGTNSLINVLSFLSIKFLFNLKLCLPSFTTIKGIFVSSLPYGASIFFILLFDRYDLAVVEWLKGEIGAGLYGGPLRVFMSILSLFLAIQIVFFSEMAGEDRDIQDTHLSLAVWIMLTLVFPLAAGGYVLRRELTLFILGDQFLASANVFGILCLGFIPQVFILIFGYKYLVINEKVGLLNKIIFLCTLLGIFGSITLGLRYGIDSVAGAILLAKVGAALACLIFTYKIRKKWPLPSGITWLLLSSSVMALSVAYLRTLLHPLFTIAIGGIIYAAMIIPINFQRIKKTYALFKRD